MAENLDFFSLRRDQEQAKNAPLADRMRPKHLDDFFGQEEVLGPGKALRRLIETDQIPSMILYGPPGSGKTSLARIIAGETGRNFVILSAVSSGVKEVRETIHQAQEDLGLAGIRTIVFIDEIHRFNKSQQDALLPYVEDGTITLIGATTENPYFEVNKALLSRTRLVELKRLSPEAQKQILDRALTQDPILSLQTVDMTPEGEESLIRLSGGDARTLLNNLESVVLSTPPVEGRIQIDREALENGAAGRLLSYDKGDEEHYNTISAFIKSVRGSDPDAALYYLARMLRAGEDPLFIARRLVILASEDIGNAEPLGLVLASAALTAVKNIGMPEARIILAQATTFLAASPKSNRSYMGLSQAWQYLSDHGDDEVPDHLKDAHYSGAKDLGHGLNYRYPHDYPGAYILQKYLPDKIMDVTFYQPSDRGYEARLGAYLASLNGGQEMDGDANQESGKRREADESSGDER